MTTSLWLVAIAFGCFLSIYLALGHRRRGTFRGIASRAAWKQISTNRKRQHINVWVFTLVVTPIVLVQAHTTWLVRGIAFLGFMGFLLAATILVEWWGRDH